MPLTKTFQVYFTKLISNIFITSFFLLGSTFVASARDQIVIVGSSTVFPFSTSVAEQFGRNTEFKTPIVESTGSGGGLKLFCAGIGLEHPDVTNSSRRIKKSEFDNCQSKGIAMTEVVIGYDGIVVANLKSAATLNLSLKQIFMATAAKVPAPGCENDCALVENPYKMWSDIDPSLPAKKIEVLGPPPTSGTRDAFQELAMQGGSKAFSTLNALKKSNKSEWKRIVHTVREDGGWIDSGENDNLMVNKLIANPDAVGVFGYSFLEQNADKLKGSNVDGVAPTFENIADGEYNISRSLYFYVKHAHEGIVPGIKEFVEEFTSESAFGDEGYLVDKGLIPLFEEERDAIRTQGVSLKKLEL
jgi:phosphate transport system substrate-binding protein